MQPNCSKFRFKQSESSYSYQNFFLKKLILKESGANYNQKNVSRDNQSQNMLDELYFSCEMVHYAKRFIAIFRDFFASINKVSFFSGRMGTRLSLFEVRHFPNIS